MKNNNNDFDLVIVGAGPAGLSAAKVAAENGLKVTIVDEFPTPGGRMIGQFHEEAPNQWWIGRHAAAELIRQNTDLDVSIQCGESVHDLIKTNQGWRIFLPEKTLNAKNLLLATGAAEVPSPVPGWTLPGVMSIGAAQVMTNVHFVKPGTRGIVIGVNVLSMAISRELTASGVELASIVLPPDNPFSRKSSKPASALKLLSDLSHLSPSPLLKLGGQIIKGFDMSEVAVHFLPRRGVNVWDVPLKLRTCALAINGTDKVESVTLADLNWKGEPIPGTERDEPVDFAAIAGGLYPLAELASVAGCKFTYVPELGGHIPIHSERLQTLVDGLYVAGNITGVESAAVAMAQGQLAATSICYDAGLLGSDGESKIRNAMQHVQDVRAEAIIQFHPGIQDARRNLYRAWEQSFLTESANM